MKKQLLLMAMALFSLSSGYAQEEGGDEEPTPEIVYTKSFQSLIDDAKYLSTSSYYTTGQSSLLDAITNAEAVISTLETNEVMLMLLRRC